MKQFPGSLSALGIPLHGTDPKSREGCRRQLEPAAPCWCHRNPAAMGSTAPCHPMSPWLGMAVTGAGPDMGSRTHTMCHAHLCQQQEADSDHRTTSGQKPEPHLPPPVHAWPGDTAVTENMPCPSLALSLSAIPQELLVASFQVTLHKGEPGGGQAVPITPGGRVPRSSACPAWRDCALAPWKGGARNPGLAAQYQMGPAPPGGLCTPTPAPLFCWRIIES